MDKVDTADGLMIKEIEARIERAGNGLIQALWDLPQTDTSTILSDLNEIDKILAEADQEKDKLEGDLWWQDYTFWRG